MKSCRKGRGVLCRGLALCSEGAGSGREQQSARGRKTTQVRVPLTSSLILGELGTNSWGGYGEPVYSQVCFFPALPGAVQGADPLATGTASSILRGF